MPCLVVANFLALTETGNTKVDLFAASRCTFDADSMRDVLVA